MIKIGKWAIGLDRATNSTIIRLEFSDRDPMEFIAPAEEARAIARAILDQHAGGGARAALS